MGKIITNFVPETQFENLENTTWHLVEDIEDIYCTTYTMQDTLLKEISFFSIK